jgi:hypothetical protein
MDNQDRSLEQPSKPIGVNSGYAAFQWAKALVTANSHVDESARRRGEVRSMAWETVLKNILNGSVAYGSRTPVHGAPAWSTLEVVKGGFATGNLLAGGPLLDFERQAAKRLGFEIRGDDRRDLNAWHLTEDGIAHLQEMLRSGHFEIDLPEEGALLTIAWLAGNGHSMAARNLAEIIAPHFARLRFYPKPGSTADKPTTMIHLQDVATTIDNLRRILPNPRILAYKEAVVVWIPLYDRIVALFLETVENSCPCQRYPDDWAARAHALLQEYTELRKSHKRCGKMERAKEHAAQLRLYLDRCASDLKSLSGRDVARIRTILECYIAKHGEPGSARFIDSRHRQADSVRKSLWFTIAGIVIERLEKLPSYDGIEAPDMPLMPSTHSESVRHGVTEETAIPAPIKKKVMLSLHAPVVELVDYGIIKSAEMLARCLPQMTSGIHAQGFDDPELRTLYAAVDRAFRRRRSLLLLNLEKQVQIEELPWVAFLENLRRFDMTSRNLACETFREITAQTLLHFPQAIIPNKLIQEMRALAKSAEIDISLVEELATDIFMREFSPKFLEAAHLAADLLQNSLYSTYYAIDYANVRRIPETIRPSMKSSFWTIPTESKTGFGALCISRAGVSPTDWSPAVNGMIIEQQQIITTQNLAALVVRLDLLDRLRGSLGQMVRHCFDWIVIQQRHQFADWHTELKLIKNSAYAWRQMIFFLSLMNQAEVNEFLQWSDDWLNSKSPDFRDRFAPAMSGLRFASMGVTVEAAPRSVGEVRRFLGWTNGKHWLMRNAPGRTEPASAS